MIHYISRSVSRMNNLQEKLGKNNVDYKAKIKTLQEELSTMETVQKDFVKLSQKLQVSRVCNFLNPIKTQVFVLFSIIIVNNYVMLNPLCLF